MSRNTNGLPRLRGLRGLHVLHELRGVVKSKENAVLFESHYGREMTVPCSKQTKNQGQGRVLFSTENTIRISDMF